MSNLKQYPEDWKQPSISSIKRKERISTAAMYLNLYNNTVNDTVRQNYLNTYNNILKELEDGN